MSERDQAALRKLAEVAPEFLKNLPRMGRYDAYYYARPGLRMYDIDTFGARGSQAANVPIPTTDELLAEIRRQGYNYVLGWCDTGRNAYIDVYTKEGIIFCDHDKGSDHWESCALALVEVIERERTGKEDAMNEAFNGGHGMTADSDWS